jgi:hypothetical protein
MINEDCIIPIILAESINPIFIKANRYIIKKYPEKFKNLDLESKKTMVEDLWRSEFDIELIVDSSYSVKTWSHMIFKNSISKTMFLLKWE